MRLAPGERQERREVYFFHFGKYSGAIGRNGPLSHLLPEASELVT